MIPTLNTPDEGTNEKIKNSFFLSIIAIGLILNALFFFCYGSFRLGWAMATDYTATTTDLFYFSMGIIMIFLIVMTSILMDIKKQNQTIAKGVLHLLRQSLDSPNKPRGTSFQDTLKNLFSRQPGMSGEDVSGSISVYDMSNPDNPIFQGDFNNMDEMNDLRKNLMDKMLNSPKEFKGKKMTKQEMLDILTVRELKSELKSAVESEDWLWAASLRDKIAEKEQPKKKGDSDSDKKDDPEM